MIKNIEFAGAYFNVKNLPEDKLPEVLLCGRSNVGKSSFINSLFNRKNLAKTSSTPGKTRSLNYYLIDKSFYLVDLPGIGYAKVSKQERDYWNRMLSDYFSMRKSIKLAFHLIDCRYKPTELDMKLHRYLLENNLEQSIILNKVDKLTQSGLADAKKDLLKIFPEFEFGQTLFAYSAFSSVGHKEIKEKLSLLFKS
ncbi:MAG: ribosome biogenesis GTP-binding protein YihA/YsxC [Ignavibacteria bacterium]